MFSSKITTEAKNLYSQYENWHGNKRYINYNIRYIKQVNLSQMLNKKELPIFNEYNKIIKETETEKILDIIQFVLDNFNLIQKQ